MGWNGNKSALHGGANYGSNGVFDDDTEQLIARCSNVSSNFNNLTPGELLWLPGHVGVYIGNGQVIECTVDWSNNVQYSTVDSIGNCRKNGNVNLRWQKHGKLPYINYIATDNNVTTKSIDELAKEVIAGKYGNGEARKNALGSRYREVQDRVNQMLSGNVDTTKYLSNKNYSGYSIVDALNQIGVDSSFSYRSKLAQINGITNYRGTAE